MVDRFNKYIKIREQVDVIAKKLEKQHTKHMACKMGCDLCCMDYSIFPIEFYWIKQKLKNHVFQNKNTFVKKSEECVFLLNHKCTIYEERPVIWRTHGLPLMFMNDNSEWELSACELNFLNFDLDKFTNENTFPQDKVNSLLFLANREFIGNFKEKSFGEFDLIPIRELLTT